MNRYLKKREKIKVNFRFLTQMVNNVFLTLVIR